MARSPWTKSRNRRALSCNSDSARSDGRRRRWRPLNLERLEARTLLTVSVIPDSGNAVSILGTVGDQVWLQTNNAGVFQYSTDGTNYSNLPSSGGIGGNVTVAQDATITLGDMDEVHLMTAIGQGHAITLQALGVANGDAGQLASPTLLTVNGTVTTAGGNLSILNMEGIEVESGVTISTRDIGSSTDYLNAPSVGNSGALTLKSENPDTLNPILNVDFNHPHVTVDSGAHLLAQVLPTDPYTAGAITLSAQNTNYSLGSCSFSSISVLAREASINLEGATVLGGSVNVTSNAGDYDLLGELATKDNGNDAWVAGIIEEAIPFASDLVSLPISFLFKKADATVEVGQGTAQDFTMNSAGELRFASPHDLNSGDPVTYQSSGTAISGLTEGATYFAIVDSATTIRLAASEYNATHNMPITGLGAQSASGTQSLCPDSQIAGSDVNLASTATSDAEGEAIYYGQLGDSTAGQLGLAFAVAIGIPTAQTLVDSGSQITAAIPSSSTSATGSVNVTSTASSSTNNLSRISQNLASLVSDSGTQARLQLAGGVGVDNLTCISTVSKYANIAASGNVMVTATGNNANENNVYTASYYDGTGGLSLAFEFSTADVQAYVTTASSLLSPRATPWPTRMSWSSRPTRCCTTRAPTPPCRSHRWTRRSLTRSTPARM